MQRAKLSAAVIVLLILSLAVPACGKVIYVKTDGSDANDGLSWETAKRTVKAGINAAVSGDEVWVAAGTYIGRISVRDIALYGGFAGGENELSERDWKTHVTILDGNQEGPAVGVWDATGTVTRIDGFVIRNANPVGPYDAAGILCEGGAVTIANNTITGNTGNKAGGIYCCFASASIADNIISDNTGDDAGGIYCLDSEAVISGNAIVRNYAGSAPGISLYRSEATIAGNRIEANEKAVGTGAWAAVFCEKSSAAITGNTINGNTNVVGVACVRSSNIVIAENTIARNVNSAGYAGGIHCTDSTDVSIVRNRVEGNTAAVGGGGIYYQASRPVISGNLVVGNIAGSESIHADGGGICCGSDGGIICNNTIVGNTSSRFGGGIACIGSWSAEIANNVIAFNSSGISRELGTPVLRHNCVYGNGGLDYRYLQPGIDDISADPRFVDAAAEDYHLRWDSPCINAGWNDAPGLPELDIDGQGRICWGTVDIGADEYWPVKVQIDIRPGDYPNYINMKSGGNVAVAILSTPEFNAATVDPASVELAGASVGVRGNGPMASVEDVDNDGNLDLVVHFPVRSLSLQSGATEAVLTGQIAGGDYIEGSDSVTVIPAR